MFVFWIVTPCGLPGSYQHFAEICYPVPVAQKWVSSSFSNEQRREMSENFY